MENKALIALAKEIEFNLPWYTNMNDPRLEFKVSILEEVENHLPILRVSMYDKILGGLFEPKYYNLAHLLVDKQTLLDKVIKDFEEAYTKTADSHSMYTFMKLEKLKQEMATTKNNN